ncbi:unnamed protein product [Paramecium sonneborni]|uniref:Uncharacterized protein n=1 Tax=Paramecium sonneborni TaxID=65129 RepID=A0A8S1MLV5_9CILI|nr:unnamed protein product [Paramecium sonneborni]
MMAQRNKFIKMSEVSCSLMQKAFQDIGLYRQCQRFQPKERSPQPNVQDATIYVRLRKQGLIKNKALKYCLADHCKIDVSLTKYGPPNYKIFSTSLDKKNIIKGWQMVGKPKELKYQKFIKAKEDDEIIQFQNKEELFYWDSKSNKKIELPKFQMGNGKENYFELADYYQQTKPLSRTLITETKSFDDIIPKQRRKEFRIEPKVDRSTIKRIEEEKGIKQRLKILNQLIQTYKVSKYPDGPSIELTIIIQN